MFWPQVFIKVWRKKLRLANLVVLELEEKDVDWMKERLGNLNVRIGNFFSHLALRVLQLGEMER